IFLEKSCTADSTYDCCICLPPIMLKKTPLAQARSSCTMAFLIALRVASSTPRCECECPTPAFANPPRLSIVRSSPSSALQRQESANVWLSDCTMEQQVCPAESRLNLKGKVIEDCSVV